MSAARSGWASLPSLTPASSATPAHGCLERVVRPSRRPRPARAWAGASSARASSVSSAAAPLVERQRAAARTGSAAPSASSLRSCARALSSGIARSSRSTSSIGGRAARRDQRGQPRVVGLADIMAVEILELLHVEARRRLADMVEVEPVDRLLAADDLVVAMAPAEPQQIVEQRLGQDAQLVAIVVDAERAVALATAWRRRSRGSAGRGRRSARASPSRG